MQTSELINEIKGLPKDFWDFKNYDTRDNSHGIHFYPATMIYPISKNIFNIVLKHMHVNAFFDPFMGSGTTLVEAKLCGIKHIYGTDLNPLAVLLSDVKTTNLNESQIQQLIDFEKTIAIAFETWDDIIRDFNYYIRKEIGLDVTNKNGWGNNAEYYIRNFIQKYNLNTFSITNFTNMGYWFLPKVVMSLHVIKQEIDKITDINVKKFLLIVFSETIRLTSNTRNSEFKLFRMKPEQVLTFDPDVKLEFIRILRHNVEKIKKFNLLCNYKVNTYINLDDTRELASVPDNSIDLVITSPPYGDSRTTVAYGQYSRLALHWLGLDNVKEKEIMQLDNNLLGGRPCTDSQQWALLGSNTLESSLKRIAEKDLCRANEVFSFYLDLNKCLKSIAKKTKNGGYHFWVVGNRTVKLETLRTDQIIIELAEKFGLEYVYNIERNISNKVMPSRNSPTNESGITVETMTKEHIVILRKRDKLD